MIQQLTKLKVADNSGAKKINCIRKSRNEAMQAQVKTDAELLKAAHGKPSQL